MSPALLLTPALKGCLKSVSLVTLGTSRSPLTPLFKGDLEGSKIFDTEKRTFQTSSKGLTKNKLSKIICTFVGA